MPAPPVADKTSWRRRWHAPTSVPRFPLSRYRATQSVASWDGHVTGPDLCRIPDPDLMPQILDQLDEPLTVTRGLHADQCRRRQLLIKHLGVAAGMHQLPFPGFPCLAIEPRNLLPAGMEITPYNHHRRLLSSPASSSSKQRLPGFESSLHSYPISPSFAWAGILTCVIRASA